MRIKCARLVYFSMVLGALVAASSGDRSPMFQACVTECAESQCSFQPTLPLLLRLTWWTCIDDCKYTCMHKETDSQVRQGKRIHQYYGKWPFWRFMGMQEPASVFFSALNLWVHYDGGKLLQAKIRRDHPMRSYYSWYAKLSMNAWVWSAVFHTRGEIHKLWMHDNPH